MPQWLGELLAGSGGALAVIIALVIYQLSTKSKSSTNNTNTININDKNEIIKQLIDIQGALKDNTQDTKNIKKALRIYVENNGSDDKTKEIIKKILEE
ncbi:hypothetical protein [Mycoplasmopsis sturni]|uniref:hypothetical protein n=1 Tax=Mycoplasmopsis sturni TaxID=39047 RepID=UPI00056BDA33|nr:hypothetical protein [Mycoplasmopsis sturni]